MPPINDGRIHQSIDYQWFSWLKAHGSWPNKNWRWVPQVPSLNAKFFLAMSRDPCATSLEPWALSHEPLNINNRWINYVPIPQFRIYGSIISTILGIEHVWFKTSSKMKRVVSQTFGVWNAENSQKQVHRNWVLVEPFFGNGVSETKNNGFKGSWTFSQI